MRFTSDRRCLVLCLLVAMVLGGCRPPASISMENAPVASLPAHARLISMSNEDSGVLLVEKSLPEQDGSSTIKVFYRQGHTGIFFLDADGRVGRFEAYGEQGENKPQSKIFEAVYFSETGLIKSSRSFTAAGTLESTIERTAAGEECKRTFRPDGTLLQQVLTSADGSQITREYDSKGTGVIKERSIQAGEPTTYFLPAASPELGGFNVTTCGVKILSWQCLDAEGNTISTGEMDEKGRLTISMFIGKKYMEGVYKQVWRPVAEDWNRRYYALEVVEKYTKLGVLDLDILFAVDGKRPTSMHNYFGDKQVRTLFSCDEHGYIMKYSLFDNSGRLAYESVVPEAEREPIPGLEYVIRPFEFVDGKTPAYYLEGTPYIEVIRPGKSRVNHFFAAPDNFAR